MATSGKAEETSRLFLNDHLSDVTLIVGTGSHVYRLPCHASVLSTASHVWEDYLNSTTAKNGSNKELTISDVDPDIFVIFLKYLYKMEFNTVLWLEIIPLVHLADKYAIYTLKQKCERQLVASLSLNNFARLLPLAKKLSLESLKYNAMAMVLAFGDLVLESEEFLNLDHDTVSDIVSCHSLQVSSESTVVRALWRWGSLECCRRKLVVCGTNIVEDALKNLIRHVRYDSLLDTDKTSISLQLLMRIWKCGHSICRRWQVEGFINVPSRTIADFSAPIVLIHAYEATSITTDANVQCVRFKLNKPAYLLCIDMVSSQSKHLQVNVSTTLPTGETNTYDVSKLTSVQLICQKESINVYLHECHHFETDWPASCLKLEAEREYAITSGKDQNIEEIWWPSIATSKKRLQSRVHPVSITLCCANIVGVRSLIFAPVVPKSVS